MITVRVPLEMEKRLSRLAERTGRTKTFYVREALEEHLDKMEEIYLAERVLEDVRRGREETVSLDVLIEQYGLED